LTIGGTDIFQAYMKNQCSEKPGYKGRSSLVGSRGKALWQVKGGSHVSASLRSVLNKCHWHLAPQEVDVCVNLYWVLPDAVFGQKFENA
jgi:hypothetical protein